MTPEDAGPSDAGPLCEALGEARGWQWSRCGDGSSFSLQFNGLDIVTRARIGLGVGGQTTFGEAWPEASWRFEGEVWRLSLTGHPNLPAVRVRLSGAPALAVEVVPGPSGVRLDGVRLEAALPPFAPTLPGTSSGLFQGLQVGNRALLVAVGGTPVGEITLADAGLQVNWPVATTLSDAPFTTGSLEVRAGEDALALADGLSVGATAPWGGFGWRTGGAYGLQVAAGALVRETEVLRSLAAARGHLGRPTVLIEGLWFTELGGVQAVWPVGLSQGVAALGDAEVGLAWPATWMARPEGCLDPCPEAPETLDLSLPAHQDRVARAAFALREAGVDFVGLVRGPADPVGLTAALVAFDRRLADEPRAALALGGLSLADFPADPEGCWTAEFTGPRPAACRIQADAPIGRSTSAPTADLESWAHRADELILDAGGVRLGGAPGEARLSAVLNATTGGPYLLADAPSQLAAEQADLYFEVFALNLAGLRPRAAEEGRATRWESDEALALVNWRDTPRTVVLPDHPTLEGAPRRLTPGPAYRSGATVEVPPRDLVLFRK